MMETIGFMLMIIGAITTVLFLVLIVSIIWSEIIRAIETRKRKNDAKGWHDDEYN